MIGFTERLERYGRAKARQARDWCTEEEKLSMGVVVEVWVWVLLLLESWG